MYDFEDPPAWAHVVHSVFIVPAFIWGLYQGFIWHGIGGAIGLSLATSLCAALPAFLVTMAIAMAKEILEDFWEPIVGIGIFLAIIYFSWNVGR